jgi:D-alanyl-D-alanine carboxypeptidase
VLNNTGLSQETSPIPESTGDRAYRPLDDIPEALREETAVISPQTNQFQARWLVWVGLGGLLLGTAVGLRGQFTQVDAGPSNLPLATTSETTSKGAPSTGVKPTASPDNILGHLPYQQAPEKELESITSDGSIKMRKAAARKYMEMVDAASAAGVILVPLSGFRSIQEQQYLFFQVKEERAQETAKRAAVSAPPGYSEHHTGYAVDIGDGHAPATNLNPDFENTNAFRWLKDNAARYSFELSFNKNNPQNISYEPWHWRFVGDQNSLETFYKARSLKKNVP